MADNQHIILGGGYKTKVCFRNTCSSLPSKFSLSLTLINIFHTSVLSLIPCLIKDLEKGCLLPLKKRGFVYT